MNHKAIRTWQERPGEYSFECSCGTHNKHQRFGYVRCAMEEWEDDLLGVIGPSGRCTICRHKHGTSTGPDRHPCIDCAACDRIDARPPTVHEEGLL